MLSKLRYFRVGVLVTLLAMLAVGCATSGGDITGDTGGGTATSEGGGGADDGGGSVTVGSADFTEAQLVGTMYALALEEAGFTVEPNLGLGTREVYFPALEQGDIDVVPEYLGSAYLHLTEQGGTPETEVEALRAQIEQELPEGLVLLESSQAQDQDALAVTRATAEEYDLQTVSDLEPVAGQLVIGGPAEQETRSTGLPGLREVYGLEFERFEVLDAGGQVTRQALAEGRVDVARVFSTTGFVAEDDLVILEEDKPLIAPENITPVARGEAVTPELEEALNSVSEALTTENLTELNRRIDIDKEDVDSVAREFLVQEGVIEG